MCYPCTERYLLRISPLMILTCHMLGQHPATWHVYRTSLSGIVIFVFYFPFSVINTFQFRTLDLLGRHSRVYTTLFGYYRR